MADIPGALSKLNDIEVASNAPLTESLHAKLGANINSLVDRVNAEAARIDADIKTLTATSISGQNVTITALTFPWTVSEGDIVRLELPALSSIVSPAGSTATQGIVRFKRGSTVIREYSHVGANNASLDIGGVIFDKPGAGTHTYSIEMNKPSGTTGTVTLNFNQILVQTARP